MKLLWEERDWADYLYWQSENRKMLQKLNALIKDLQRNPFQGLGKPEPLRHSLNNYWSRRIDKANRLVYAVKDDVIYILACRGHYE